MICTVLGLLAVLPYARLAEQDQHRDFQYASNVDGDGQYIFAYDTGHDNEIAHSLRMEHRDADGVVRGRYGYTDPEGKFRLVEYEAGPDGFMARGDVGPDPYEHTQVPGGMNSSPLLMQTKHANIDHPNADLKGVRFESVPNSHAFASTKTAMPVSVESIQYDDHPNRNIKGTPFESAVVKEIPVTTKQVVIEKLEQVEHPDSDIKGVRHDLASHKYIPPLPVVEFKTEPHKSNLKSLHQVPIAYSKFPATTKSKPVTLVEHPNSDIKGVRLAAASVPVHPVKLVEEHPYRNIKSVHQDVAVPIRPVKVVEHPNANIKGVHQDIVAPVPVRQVKLVEDHPNSNIKGVHQDIVAPVPPVKIVEHPNAKIKSVYQNIAPVPVRQVKLVEEHPNHNIKSIHQDIVPVRQVKVVEDPNTKIKGVHQDILPVRPARVVEVHPNSNIKGTSRTESLRYSKFPPKPVPAELVKEVELIEHPNRNIKGTYYQKTGNSKVSENVRVALSPLQTAGWDPRYNPIGYPVHPRGFHGYEQLRMGSHIHNGLETGHKGNHPSSHIEKEQYSVAHPKTVFSAPYNSRKSVEIIADPIIAKEKFIRQNEPLTIYNIDVDPDEIRATGPSLIPIYDLSGEASDEVRLSTVRETIVKDAQKETSDESSAAAPPVSTAKDFQVETAKKIEVVTPSEAEVQLEKDLQTESTNQREIIAPIVEAAKDIQVEASEPQKANIRVKRKNPVVYSHYREAELKRPIRYTDSHSTHSSHHHDSGVKDTSRWTHDHLAEVPFPQKRDDHSVVVKTTSGGLKVKNPGRWTHDHDAEIIPARWTYDHHPESVRHNHTKTTRLTLAHDDEDGLPHRWTHDHAAEFKHPEGKSHDHAAEVRYRTSKSHDHHSDVRHPVTKSHDHAAEMYAVSKSHDHDAEVRYPQRKYSYWGYTYPRRVYYRDDHSMRPHEHEGAYHVYDNDRDHRHSDVHLYGKAEKSYYPGTTTNGQHLRYVPADKYHDKYYYWN